MSAKIDASSPMVQRQRKVREYTLGEEIANAITHGIGAGLSIAALVLLIVKSVCDGGGLLLLSGLFFGISLVIEYTMSTMYHALAHEGAKRVFKVLDHSCIYLLIAGTYTPYCLVTLMPYGGFVLFFVIWGLAVVGIAFEAFWTFRPRWISAVLYVAMGWCIIAYVPTLYDVLAPAGFWLLLAGGLSYTVGAILYVLKKVKFMHSVFHVFVVGGSVCQFLSVYLFVI